MGCKEISQGQMIGMLIIDKNIGENTELLTYIDLYDTRENDDISKTLDRDYQEKLLNYN